MFTGFLYPVATPSGSLKACIKSQLYAFDGHFFEELKESICGCFNRIHLRSTYVVGIIDVKFDCFLVLQ